MLFRGVLVGVGWGARTAIQYANTTFLVSLNISFICCSKVYCMLSNKIMLSNSCSHCMVVMSV